MLHATSHRSHMPCGSVTAGTGVADSGASHQRRAHAWRRLTCRCHTSSLQHRCAAPVAHTLACTTIHPQTCRLSIGACRVCCYPTLCIYSTRQCCCCRTLSVSGARCIQQGVLAGRMLLAAPALDAAGFCRKQGGGTPGLGQQQVASPACWLHGCTKSCQQWP